MRRTTLASVAAVAAALSLVTPPAHAAQTIQRVVATPAFHHVQEVAASKDGRYLAVVAYPTAPIVVADQTAPNWSGTPVVGPTVATPLRQVYLVDRVTHTARLVSANKAGAPADHDAYDVSMSADGRYVTFTSQAKNLLPVKAPNGIVGAFLYDRVARTISRVSLDWRGAEVDMGFAGVAVSPDGSTVLFSSKDAVLRGDKANLAYGIYARDRRTGRVWAVSRAKTGAVAHSYNVGLLHPSRTGRYVALNTGVMFDGAYGPEGSYGKNNVYVLDTKTGGARLVRGNTADDARCPQQAHDANACSYDVQAVAIDPEGTRVAYVVQTIAFSVPLNTRVVSVDLVSGQATVLASVAAGDVGGLAYSLDGSALYFVAPPQNNESVTGARVLYRGTIATHGLAVVTTLPAVASCRTDGCATIQVGTPAPVANGVAFATDAPLTDDDTNGLGDAYVSTG